MSNDERNELIDVFLEAWDEMIRASSKIEDFNFNFKVSISSDNSIADDRVRTINGINESFTRHNIGWSSSNG